MQPSPEVINLSHIYACNNNNNTWSNAPERAPNHFTKCQDTWVAYILPGGICNSSVWRITKLQITSLETILPHHFSRHLSKSPRKSVVFKTEEWSYCSLAALVTGIIHGLPASEGALSCSFSCPATLSSTNRHWAEGKKRWLTRAWNGFH